MAKLIAVTGNIGSGKSTTISNFLKTNEGHTCSGLTFGYCNLDDICKELMEYNLDIKTRFAGFFEKNFGEIVPSKEFILKNVIGTQNSMGIYAEYLAIFSDRLILHLAVLGTSKDYDYILVEAPALYSYVEAENYNSSMFVQQNRVSMLNMFDSVIHFDVDFSNRMQLIRQRGFSKDEVRMILSRQDSSWRSGRQLAQQKNLCIIINEDYNKELTFLELRGRFELALLKSIVEEDYGRHNLDKLVITDFLDYFENLPEKLWNGNPYHNKDHTRTVITSMLLQNLNGRLTMTELNAAIFHDICYDQMSTEEVNISVSCDFAKSRMKADGIFLICPQLIDETISIIKKAYPYSGECVRLKHADLSHFTRTPEEIIETEKLLFKEFSMFDFNVYKKEHRKILMNIREEVDLRFQKGIDIALGWLKTFEPSIGWFCGSFDPFHSGHLDILQKAQTMFDKVILIKGFNPEKNGNDKSLPQIEELKYVEKINLSPGDTIPDLIISLGYTPTLIRGIRNIRDVEDSRTWVSQINTFLPTERFVNVCMIDGDPKYNHISSTFLRSIESRPEYKRFVKQEY